MATAIVTDIAEGLSLLQTLLQAAQTVSGQIQQAQLTNTPVDWTPILGGEATAEANVLAAIAAAKAAGH